MKRIDRPSSILVLGILHLCLSSLGIIGGILSLVIFLTLSDIPVFESQIGMLTTYDFVVSLLGIVFALCGVIAGYGAVAGKNWGRKAMLGLVITMLLFNTMNLILYFTIAPSGVHTSIWMVIFSYIWAVTYYGITIWYFTRPAAKEWFGN